MDDKRLQSEFDDYFRGANLPSDMTADAKAHAKSHNREVRKWFLRLAPVAAAFVLVVALSIVFVNRYFPTNIKGGDTGVHYSYYNTAQLTDKPIDAYSAADIKGLEFAEKLAFMSNSNINLTAFYESKNMILAKAEISLLHNGYRHDAVLYAEYTDEYRCLEEVKEYLSGEENYYKNYTYLLTCDRDEGEPVYMVYIYTGGVKYYLSVTTSEINGYKIYLDLLKNN